MDGLIGCRTLHERWDETPPCGPNERGDYCEDFFGGDLAGITEKFRLPRLAPRHHAPYLNPIFEAASNHRYDTAGLRNGRPCSSATSRTSAPSARRQKSAASASCSTACSTTPAQKSRYFNADGYPAPGAAGPHLPYYSWYSFHPFPTDYDAWWGIKNLPAVNERNESYVNYIITGENSIVRRWLARAQARGGSMSPTSCPTNLSSPSAPSCSRTSPTPTSSARCGRTAPPRSPYSKRRRYLLGNGLHGLMNYPFRTALLSYLAGTSGGRTPRRDGDHP